VKTVATALSLLFMASCGGSSTETATPTATVVAGKGGPLVVDPSKWPKDDKSMCDWKGKPDLAVDEVSGPGALRPNVRRVYKMVGEGDARHKSIICREVDTNLDGIKDIVRTFNAKGEALHEEADTNYDGKIDVWVSFINGRMAEEQIDSHFTGKVDVWKVYVDGELNRIKRDTNGDGKPDVWEIYVKGKLDRIGIDTEFDGHVDRWDRDVVALRASEEADVKARQAMQAAQDGGAAPQGDLTPDAGGAAKVGKATRTTKKKEAPPPKPPPRIE
jgi:hypothetical protein